MADWEEVIRLPVIRESWGLEETETAETFADMVYGLKFAFDGGPGYVGDLYILHGDALGEPFTLIRKDSMLVVL